MGLKKFLKKAAPMIISPFSGAGFFKKGSGGGGPVDFGFTDPNSIQQITGLPAGVSRRRNLSDILTDFAFNEGDAGPSIEDDSAAYDRYLDAGESARRREEQAATDQVMEGAQSRGLARSGIALKDIITQVLGPSFERGNQLASQFGLEKARRRSDLLEAERGRRASANQQRLGGRLQAILGSDTADRDYDSQVLGGLQDFQTARLGGALDERRMNLENQIQNRRDMEARRRQRKGGLSGLIGGGIGGLFGGPGGAQVGMQAGQTAGAYF